MMKTGCYIQEWGHVVEGRAEKNEGLMTTAEKESRFKGGAICMIMENKHYGHQGK